MSSDIINESFKKEMLLELLNAFISLLLNESPHTPLDFDSKTGTGWENRPGKRLNKFPVWVLSIEVKMYGLT